MDKDTTPGVGDDFAPGHPPEAVPKPPRSGQGTPGPGPDRAGQVRQPTEAGFQCRPAVTGISALTDRQGRQGAARRRLLRGAAGRSAEIAKRRYRWPQGPGGGRPARARTHIIPRPSAIAGNARLTRPAQTRHAPRARTSTLDSPRFRAAIRLHLARPRVLARSAVRTVIAFAIRFRAAVFAHARTSTFTGRRGDP